MSKKFIFKNGGIWYNQMAPQFIPDKLSEPKLKVNKSLPGVPREEADLEAEKGEVIMIPSKFGGIPATYKIGGKRHYEGGTPLKAPNDSFIYSDTNSMKIKEKELLEQFGKTKKKGVKGYTPAELANKYDINEYVKILASPDSDKFAKKTAELMIKNYNIKLGKLALVQEAKKGFPQGVPIVALPYMDKVGTTAESILPQMAPQQMQQGMPQQNAMAQSEAQYEMVPPMQYGGSPEMEEDTELDYDVISNIISQFAQLTGGDAKQIMMQLQELPEEDQMVTIQQMAEALQQPMTMEAPMEEQVMFEEPAYMQGQAMMKQGGSLKKYQDGEQVTKKYKNGPREGKDLIVSRIKGESDIDFQARLQQTQKIATKDQKIFVEKPGGGYQLLKGVVMPSTKIDDPRLGKLQTQYGQLDYLFRNNKNLQQDLYKQFQEKIKGFRSGLSQGQKDELLKLTPEEVTEIFLEGQKQNYAINASGTKVVGDPSWDTYPRNKRYKEVMSQLGFDAFDDTKIRAFQGIFKSIQELADDPKYKDVLANFDVTPIGKKDQTDEKGRPISPIDAIYGNTTAGEIILPKDAAYNLLDLEEEKEEDKVEPYDVEPLDATETGVTPARWWTQDVANTLGSIGDIYSVNRYYPTLQTVNYELPSPTFISPERALAANAEQAAIASQALGAFAGPQALSSRVSSVQGKAAANAANIMDQVNKQNVGIANTFELTRKQISNEQNRQNAAIMKNFYDETVATNQNYDDTTRALRVAARQNYITGLTNAGKTAAMNAMYPHFQTDPVTGNVIFTRGSTMKPSAGSAKTPLELYDIYRSDPNYSDLSNAELIKLITASSKNQPQDEYELPDYYSYPTASNPQNKQ
jgi:hypothetical protein